jgi:hypothetical protein
VTELEWDQIGSQCCTLAQYQQYRVVKPDWTPEAKAKPLVDAEMMLVEESALVVEACWHVRRKWQTCPGAFAIWTSRLRR